jgi:phosphoribosylpyrophosphate synthetase
MPLGARELSMKKLTLRIPQDRDVLYSVIHYPAGEIQVRLTAKGLASVKGKDEFEIICNPIPDIIELAQLKDCLDHAGKFWRTSLFLPYMPYARADRRFVGGDCLGIKVWGDLINSLNFSTVWTFDIHSSRAYSYVQNLANFSPEDVFARDPIRMAITKLGRKGLVLVIPDAGAAGRYELNRYSLPIVQGLKHRDASTGKLTGFGVAVEEDNDGYGHVIKAKKALIVDDICDGGGTFIGLAEALHKINPDLKLYLYVSHGIFSKGQKALYKHFEAVFTSEYSIQP